jgi:hypothetical protein
MMQVYLRRVIDVTKKGRVFGIDQAAKSFKAVSGPTIDIYGSVK